jgi:hypothetical protein
VHLDALGRERHAAIARRDRRNMRDVDASIRELHRDGSWVERDAGITGDDDLDRTAAGFASAQGGGRELPPSGQMREDRPTQSGLPLFLSTLRAAQAGSEQIMRDAGLWPRSRWSRFRDFVFRRRS